jgi:hypothetical protein
MKMPIHRSFSWIDGFRLTGDLGLGNVDVSLPSPHAGFRARSKG